MTSKAQIARMPLRDGKYEDRLKSAYKLAALDDVIGTSFAHLSRIKRDIRRGAGHGRTPARTRRRPTPGHGVLL
jgi:hypothetical protein